MRTSSFARSAVSVGLTRLSVSPNIPTYRSNPYYRTIGNPQTRRDAVALASVGENGCGCSAGLGPSKVRRVRCREAWLIASLMPLVAVAGSITSFGIVATTPTASHVALTYTVSGSAEELVCDLARSTPKPSVEDLLIRADCLWTNGTIPPFEQARGSTCCAFTASYREASPLLWIAPNCPRLDREL